MYGFETRRCLAYSVFVISSGVVSVAISRLVNNTRSHVARYKDSISLGIRGLDREVGNPAELTELTRS